MDPWLGDPAGVLTEAILTFFLVTTIFMAAVHRKAAAGMAGIAIGGMIFLRLRPYHDRSHDGMEMPDMQSAP